MKPLTVLYLLSSILHRTSAVPLNATTTLDARAPGDWKDPIGPIARGYFSVLIHSGKIEFYSDINSEWYKYGLEKQPCDMEDVYPMATSGWKNFTAADSTNFHDMPHTFWMHPGNQCGGAHSRGQQLDNTWIYYSAAKDTPGKGFINVITDTRCGEYHFSNPSPSEWTQVLSFRCILPLGTNPKPKPAIGVLANHGKSKNKGKKHS